MNYGSRTILRFDILGAPIAAYPDICAAAEDLNMSPRNLKLAVQRRTPVGEPLSYLQYAGTEPWEPYNPPIRYEQYDPKTGATINRFTTIAQAARLLNVSENRLHYFLKKNRRDPFGAKWRRVPV